MFFFLVDDLGWTDLGCYGNQFHETPNIDRLAQQGMRFTNAYAACAVCSPTRASIMTGKYPARLHLTDWIPGRVFPHARLHTPGIRYELPLEEGILPEKLKEAGYHTFHVGKWHLGEEEQFWPLQQGFDENIGGHSKGSPGSYFHPYGKQTAAIDRTVKNLPQGGREGNYLTDRLTGEAIKLLESVKGSGKPFFLNMSYYTVHKPLEAKEAYVEKYERKKAEMELNHVNTTYAAMIQSLDESVGRILDRLDEMGMAENTLIILTSDNGELVEVDGNAPFRAGKGFYYEGGVRELLIVRYPAKVPAASVQHKMVSSIDFYPAIFDVCHTSSEQVIDGISIWPLLQNPQDSLERKALYWHYPHYHTPQRPPTGAIRVGDYKLIEFYEDMLELYNLEDDIGEINNLAVEMPEWAEKLSSMLHKWREEVGAAMPSDNPDYNPKSPFSHGVTGWKGENRLQENE